MGGDTPQATSSPTPGVMSAPAAKPYGTPDPGFIGMAVQRGDPDFDLSKVNVQELWNKAVPLKENYLKATSGKTMDDPAFKKAEDEYSEAMGKLDLFPWWEQRTSYQEPFMNLSPSNSGSISTDVLARLLGGGGYA